MNIARGADVKPCSINHYSIDFLMIVAPRSNDISEQLAAVEVDGHIARCTVASYPPVEAITSG